MNSSSKSFSWSCCALLMQAFKKIQCNFYFSNIKLIFRPIFVQILVFINNNIFSINILYSLFQNDMNNLNSLYFIYKLAIISYTCNVTTQILVAIIIVKLIYNVTLRYFAHINPIQTYFSMFFQCVVCIFLFFFLWGMCKGCYL